MKRLLSIVLMLVLCLSVFVGCNNTPAEQPDETGDETVDTSEYLTLARNFLQTMYKDKGGKIMRDFDMVGVVNIDGTAYDVDWTTTLTSGNEGDVAIVDNGTTVTVDINEKPTAELAFTLTGTLKDDAGNTETVAFDFSVDAVATTGTIFVETPEVGVPYKFALNQNGLSTPATLYFTGNMSGNYLETSENVLDAVDVYVEETEGGYNIYFQQGEAKKYVTITTYVNDEGVTKKTQKIADEPATPFTWDAERGTMITEVEGIGPCYLGCYGTYKTMSASETSYIENVSVIGASQFPAGFATVVPAVVEAPVAGQAYLFGLQQNNIDGQPILYFTGEMSGNYLATSDKISDAVRVYLEETDGGYYLVFLKDGAKKYINVTTYAKDDGSLKNTQKIEDVPSVPYTWDAERLTSVADLGDLGKFYLGTYNTYNTISSSNVSYIDNVSVIGVSQFPAGFYDLKLPAEDLSGEVAVEYPEMTLAEAVAADDDTKVTVSGTVIEIGTAWSDEYKNISVTISDGKDTLYLYRLATNVQVGDVITVQGAVGSYKGAKQLAQGATAEITGTHAPATIPEAVAMDDGALVVVTGTVVTIDTEWSDKYGNITVTINDAEGNSLYLYRLGTNVQVGDEITVYGTVGSYNGAKQLAQGSFAIITEAPADLG